MLLKLIMFLSFLPSLAKHVLMYAGYFNAAYMIGNGGYTLGSGLRGR